MAARRQGDRDAELRLLNAALAAAPDNPLANNARGMRALEDRDFPLAASHFAAAAAADSGEPALWLNLAAAHRGAADMAGEEAALSTALACDQLNFMAKLRMAELQQRKGADAIAAEHWRQLLAIAPAADDLPPAITARLEEARTFVAAQNRAFAQHLEAGLAAPRAAADPSARRRFDACMDFVAGRRTIYASQPSGLHYPFLPADEFFERRHFPWMAALEARTDAIRAELVALLEARRIALRPYVQQSPGTPDNKWSALDGSPDWSAAFLWEYGKAHQPVIDACPETAAAIAAIPRNDIPGRAPTAFFSLLRPRSRIPPHSGVTNSRAIVHLPLIVPPGCGFRVGGETRPWVEGQAFAFDDTIEHEAWNDSDQLRAVLILDVWNPHLSATEQALLTHFFALADSSGHNPAAAT